MGGVSASRMPRPGRPRGIREASVAGEQRRLRLGACPGAPAQAAAGATPACLEVRGDGQRYKLNLRTDDNFDGIYIHQAGFTPPAGEWAWVRLPLAGFVATWRGRPSLRPRR